MYQLYLKLQDLHSRMANEAERPAEFNYISTLVDITMEMLRPDMELRPGNVTEMAQLVGFNLINLLIN